MRIGSKPQYIVLDSIINIRCCYFKLVREVSCFGIVGLNLQLHDLRKDKILGCNMQNNKVKVSIQAFPQPTTEPHHRFKCNTGEQK